MYSDEQMLAAAHALAERYMRKERRGGGTMLDHCIHVASELAHAGQPLAVVCGGMLHDIREDAGEFVSDAQLRTSFGAEVAHIVDVLTKPGPDKKHERRYLMRMELSGREPITVKLVDNTHNLETILRIKKPREYVKYGKRIQEIGAKILGENNPFVLKHLRALRSAEAELVNLPL